MQQLLERRGGGVAVRGVYGERGAEQQLRPRGDWLRGGDGVQRDENTVERVQRGVGEAYADG